MWPWWWTKASRPPRSERPCSMGAGSCCAWPRSSISIGGSSSARGARALPSGSPSVPPTGPSRTRRSPSAGWRSRPPWRRSGARSVNRVLVAGASGYAGALAAELIRRHPSLELARVTARTDAGRPLNELYPEYGVDLVLEEPVSEDGSDVDAAVVAYPHGAAAPVVAALREQGVKVVDLSADFRLHDLDTYSRWYGEHGAPQLVPEAVYGLTELHREAIAGAELVANPGCYPTASLLALAPLAAKELIEDVVIDAKSGVTGAGRAAAEEMAVVKESDDTKPYKVGGHRHTPEIAQELAELAGNGATPMEYALTFVPHLMPYDQGELVSCYVRTTEPLDPAG